MADTARLAWLDRFVHDNRFTIAVIFPLVGAITLIASAETFLPAVIAFNPYLLLFGTLVMRLPLVAALRPLLTRGAVLWFAGFIGYTYLIEWIGLTTGWPYGSFTYTIELGPMIEGVPLGLPVFFIPLVVNAYLLALLVTKGNRALVPVAIGTVLAIDFLLDPAAVALGFWQYPTGTYYGVPASNFAGWLLSGSIGIFMLDQAFDRSALHARLHEVSFALDDLVSFVLLWGGVNVFYGQWVPVTIAIGFGVALLRTDRFSLPRFRGSLTQKAS